MAARRAGRMRLRPLWSARRGLPGGLPVAAGWRRLVERVRSLSAGTPLRVKLIAAMLVLVTVGLTVSGVAGVAALRRYLLERVDSQFTATAQELIGSGDICGTLAAYGGLLSASGWYVSADLSGGPSCTSPSPPRSSGQTAPVLPALDTDEARRLAGRPFTVPAAGAGHDWRVQVSLLLDAGGAVVGVLAVGACLDDVDATVGQLTAVELMVGAVVLFVLAVLGYALIRSSLRPLVRVEATAAAIAAGDLTRRVPQWPEQTEVGRLARALNGMLAQIETAFQAREAAAAQAGATAARMRRFVADASHELRTPLTAIRGFAELLRHQAANPGTAGRTAAVDPVAGDAGAVDPVAGRAGAMDPAGGRAGAVGPVAGGTAAVGRVAGGAGTVDTVEGAAESADTVDGAAGAADTVDGALVRRVTDRIEQAAIRMGLLVANMLQLARLDQQLPVQAQPVDLLALAMEAASEVRVAAPGHPVTLAAPGGTGGGPPVVHGEEAALRQVIGNLLSNACQHTPPGTPVTVTVTTEADRAVLEVTDTGPGLHPEHAGRIFERFYRVDPARNRSSGGTGLGLSIVESIVTAHGGTVTVRSTPGEGATFRVSLPLAGPDPGGDRGQPGGTRA